MVEFEGIRNEPYESKRVTMILNPGLNRALEYLKDRYGMNRTEVVNHCVMAQFNALLAADKKKREKENLQD